MRTAEVVVGELYRAVVRGATRVARVDAILGRGRVRTTHVYACTEIDEPLELAPVVYAALAGDNTGHTRAVTEDLHVTALKQPWSEHAAERVARREAWVAEQNARQAALDAMLAAARTVDAQLERLGLRPWLKGHGANWAEIGLTLDADTAAWFAEALSTIPSPLPVAVAS